MNLHRRLAGRSARLALAGALAAFGGAVAAADGPAAAVDARYQQERARCMSGQSGQAQETCLKEAAAARQISRKDPLTDADAQNAARRCDVQTGDARRDCLARAQGTGNTTTSGSVKEGGVLRTTTTVVPAASAASAR